MAANDTYIQIIGDTKYYYVDGVLVAKEDNS